MEKKDKLKAKFHIPTVQYGFIEVEVEAKDEKELAVKYINFEKAVREAKADLPPF